MDSSDFKMKLARVCDIAHRYQWELLSIDNKCGRISLRDELSIFRVDIYTSKMTLCFIPAGDSPLYLKRQSIEMIEAILKNPFNISNKNSDFKAFNKRG